MPLFSEIPVSSATYTVFSSSQAEEQSCQHSDAPKTSASNAPSARDEGGAPARQAWLCSLVLPSGSPGNVALFPCAFRD